METNLNNNADRLYRPSCTEAEAGSYSPLVLAFMGDTVYETAVRTMLVMRGNARPNDLNKQKNRLVKAAAQSAMMDALEQRAAELGFGRAILQTRPQMEAAVHLYTKRGYELIDNYPPYDKLEGAICFAKRL